MTTQLQPTDDLDNSAEVTLQEGMSFHRNSNKDAQGPKFLYLHASCRLNSCGSSHLAIWQSCRTGNARCGGPDRQVWADTISSKLFSGIEAVGANP